MELKNTYYMLRHGEAVSNATEVFSCWPETFENPLTPRGVAMANEAAAILEDKGIDLVFASDILRAKQTAQIAAEKLGLEIVFDERLREIDFGDFNGKPIGEIGKYIGDGKMVGYDAVGGEDYGDVKKRMADFLQEIDGTYEDKVILIVSHQSPLCMLEEWAKEIPLMEMVKMEGYRQMEKAEVRKLESL